MNASWIYIVLLATPISANNNPPNGKMCKLPEYPANGTYATDIPNAKPGEAYDSVTINVTCAQGYGVVGSDSVRCHRGSWTESIPKCVITHCHLPSHPSVEYHCQDVKPSSTRVCEEFEPLKTVVRPQCRSPVYYSKTHLHYMHCNEGKWNYIAKCIPECGTVTPAVKQLIIGGESAKRAEVPWHAGIYSKDTRPYKQICGGSLVKNNIVISAAHCFWNSIEGALPAADYAVAVGKLYRPWINTRDEAQQSDVKEVHLPEHFQGSAANFQADIAVVIVTHPFEYTAHIRPVCLDFNISTQENQLKAGSEGKVAGWGLTAENGLASQVLKVINLPYVTTWQCITESPPDFRTYITTDKMCAGYRKAGKALCKGDSGGGLTFPRWDDGVERYYLRGVASTAPNNDNLCNDNTYTSFTLLLKHEHFVKYWLNEGAAPIITDESHRVRPKRVNRNVVRTFVDPFASPPAPFHHLAVHRNTDHVYIGALNKIHHLTPNLERTQWIVTGPVMNSNECYICSDNFTLVLTDNANKVLVIDYGNSRLITCGSVFQGMCSIRNLSDISFNVREVHEPVAAQDAESSTVAFIAPGPPNPPITKVLYVGATYSNNSLFYIDAPSVSSRSLNDDDDDLFTVPSTILSDASISVSSLARKRYLINYVYGFNSEGFSYFLTTQRREGGSGTYHSKLVRVCDEDRDYYSYTEIPLSCSGEGDNIGFNLVQAAFVGKAGPALAAELGIATQGDVLFGAFSQSESIKSNKPSNRSAICVYSLKAIRRKFMQNIQKCFSGDGFRGLDFITPSFACFATEMTITEDFCGLDMNSPLGGELPVEAAPAAVFETRLTALTATAIGHHTVLFAGTADGYLKKIVVENSSFAIEYAHIDVDEGSPINKDLIFDTHLTHLYVMTERSVSKVRVQECNEYKSCLACLGARDPYCGWRPVDNECSLRPGGQNSTLDSQQWISYHSGRCLTISKVIPNQLQRTTPATFNLFIDNMPTYKEQLVCAFTAFGRSFVTNATRTSSGVSCGTPSTDALPLVPDSQDYFAARLSVRTAQGPDLVATEIKFFDCSSFRSCTKCVTSPFPCDWCLDRSQCTHDAVEHCHNNALVTSDSKADSLSSGFSFCPSIDPNGTNEILTPYGENEFIKFKVIVRSPMVAQSKFVCQFSIEGRVVNASGRLLNDTIHCDRVEFTYASLEPNMTVPLAVVWGGSNILDNPGNTRVLVYGRSGVLAPNCGKCLAQPETFLILFYVFIRFMPEF